MDATSRVDESSKWAVLVEDADFQWEEVLVASSKDDDKKSKRRRAAKKQKPETPVPGVPQEPFALRHVSLTIPRGQLTAIVGGVGSGKSSLLQALIGEMKQTRGTKPVFGGRVAYCSQMAWIQNATLRENVLFGAEYDEDRYWSVVQDASLLSDLEMLPDGDLTEVRQGVA